MAKKWEAVKMSGFVLDDSGGGRTAWQQELKIRSITGVGVNVAVVKEQLDAATCSLSQLTALMGWL